ncbi:helix-turn-helix domain-containing protein [Vibrio harveyi]|nr:helix-turn-helix domain-containing protein [Vibrio harveyi]
MVRAELADHYLEKSQMSLAEISFLLGFQEVNSFIRAYSTWRGVSPGHYREQRH